MEKKFLKKQEEKLTKEKERLEKILFNIVKEDKKGRKKVKGKYFEFDEKIPLEETADEVEEYTNILSVEKRLEVKLKNIKKALNKIKKEKKYGLCEKCQKKITKERLKIMPEAKLCSKCL